MAEVGPPVGADAGSKRPRLCLSNGDGSPCPQEWLISISDCFSKASGDDVSVKKPFKGGYHPLSCQGNPMDPNRIVI
jgi:hypothetical protein